MRGLLYIVILFVITGDSVSSNNVYKTFAEYRAAGTTETVAKDSVREKAAYDGQTQFVIYGVDVTSPEFKEWDFIYSQSVTYLTRSLSASSVRCMVWQLFIIVTKYLILRTKSNFS